MDSHQDIAGIASYSLRLNPIDLVRDRYQFVLAPHPRPSAAQSHWCVFRFIAYVGSFNVLLSPLRGLDQKGCLQSVELTMKTLDRRIENLQGPYILVIFLDASSAVVQT